MKRCVRSMAHIISLDGLSGSGKSTMAGRLASYIHSTFGRGVHLFREPSQFLRSAIKEYRGQPREERDPWVESYLLAADRRQQYLKEIEPLLGTDAVILMDRSKYSAYAYQGEDIPLEELVGLNRFFPEPDLAFFLLCEPETAVERIGRRGEQKSSDECLGYIHGLKMRFEHVADSVPHAQAVYTGGSEGAVFHQLRSGVDALLGKQMQKAVFLDKDGVLVDYDVYPAKIPTDELYPWSIEALQKLKASGYSLYIVSNQPWIGKGRMTSGETEAAFESIRRKCAAQGVVIDGYAYCPHKDNDGCACKKPGTALLEQIAGEANCDMLGSYLIGDSASDIVAGRRMGLKTILVGTGCGPEKKEGCMPGYAARDILQAAEIICGDG